MREPSPSRVSGAAIVLGRIARGRELALTSEMPGHGVIFSDGIEADFLDFNSGTRVAITVADRAGLIVV